MIKHFITASILLLFFGTTFAQFPSFDWVKDMAGTNQDVSFSNTIDNNQNPIHVGYFAGNLQLDPNGGTQLVNSAGSFDIFIQKLDAFGNLLWAHRIGGTGDDQARSVTTDNANNVIVTGHFSGTVDFDPGSGVVNATSNGSFDIFVLKLDANGNLIWVRTFGGAGVDYSKGVAVDETGAVYTTGSFSQTVDFNPGVGTTWITEQGSGDIFVHKLDVNGNFDWVNNAGDIESDIGFDIVITNNNEIYTTGYFSGAGSSGHRDVYIQRFDMNGNVVWVRTFGGQTIDTGYGITTDNGGDVYITGRFTGTADFDPNAGVFNLVSNGGEDVFICRVNAAGNLVWATSFGGIGNDIGHSIKVDASQNIYTTGHFINNVDFDPGVRVRNAASSGSYDLYLHRMDGNANFIGVHTIGSTGGDYGYDLVLNDNCGLLLSGVYANTASDFNPGGGVETLVSAGSIDGFLLQLGEIRPIPNILMSSYQYYPVPMPKHAQEDHDFQECHEMYLYETYESRNGNNYTHYYMDLWVRDCGTSHSFSWVQNINPSNGGWVPALVPYPLNLKATFNSLGVTFIPGKEYMVKLALGNSCFGWEATTYTFCVDDCALPSPPEKSNKESLMQQLDPNAITIYPNPTNNFLNVNAAELEIGMIRLIDALGRQINSYSNTTQINVQELHTGMYILEIHTDKGVVNKRFVKK